MKKLKFLALAVIASFALVACGPSAESMVKDIEASVEQGDMEAFEKACKVADEAVQEDSAFFSAEQEERIKNAAMTMLFKQLGGSLNFSGDEEIDEVDVDDEEFADDFEEEDEEIVE